MFKWTKLGRIFDPTQAKGIEWMKEYAQSPSVIVMEDRMRIYFSCRPARDSKGLYVSYLAYADFGLNSPFELKGISEKPLLDLGELGTFDEFGTNPASAIRYKDEIRMYYCGWTRCESVPFNSSIGLATSTDQGTTFTKLGKGPVLSFTPDEPFLLGSPRIKRFDNVWYLWYAGGIKWIENNGRPEPVYKIKLAKSDDGITWSKAGRNLIETVLEEDECQASPEVFYHQGKYHMFFSYRYSVGYRSKQHGYRIGYAESNDLINWKRNDAKAGITISETGWDSEMISYAHIFTLNDKIYMIYQGNEFGRYGFGLAVLEE